MVRSNSGEKLGAAAFSVGGIGLFGCGSSASSRRNGCGGSGSLSSIISCRHQPQSAPAAICCGHAESCLGGRCHDGLYASGLALCGSAARSLFTAGHRLGDAGEAGSAVDAHGARDGDPSAAHPSRFNPSLGSRGAIQLCRVSTAAPRARDHAQHESEGQLL